MQEESMRWSGASRLIDCHQADLKTSARAAGVGLSEQLPHHPNAFLPNLVIPHQQDVHITALRHPAA
jgi:hypothetical protein